MRTLIGGSGAVPGLAFPVQRVLGRVLVKALPPNGVVVEIMRHVGKDGASLGGLQSVKVGFGVRAGRDAEESVFGVDGIQSAVRTGTHPRDVVADCPDLIALTAVALRRNQHRKIRLAAGRRERRRNIGDLALGILDAQNQHMLRHPALLTAQIGCDAQRKAFFAQQNVSAVTGVHGNDGVILREMAYVALFLIDLAFAVQSAHPLGIIAQNIPNRLANTGHDRHVQHNVDGIRQFNADFCQRRTNRAHGVGNHIHCAALIAVPSNIIKHLVGFLRLHPVVSGACILFLAGADKGTILHAGNVIDRCAVQIAIRQLFLVELNELTGRASLCSQLFDLLL